MVAPEPTAVLVPARLPADIPEFTGRDAELATITSLLTVAEGQARHIDD